eukprot:gene7846-10653_t
MLNNNRQLASLKQQTRTRALSAKASRNVGPGYVPYKTDDIESKSPINTEKRKQLETILQREKLKEKRRKIASALTQNLVTKFGSENQRVIAFFVDEFLGTHGEINAEDLTILEKEIRTSLQPSQSGEQYAPKKSEENFFSKDQSTIPQTSSSLPERPPTGSEWVVIQAYQMVMNDEKEKQEQERARMKKMNFKKALDDQISQSRKYQTNDKDIDNNYFEFIKSDMSRYYEEEQKKKATIKKKYQDEIEIRQKQIYDQKKRLEDEKESFRREEERNLLLAKLKIDKENEIAQQAKARELNHRKKMMEENAENLKIHEVQKKKEAEEDFKLMQEYAAKLDREALERENAFKKRMENMEFLGNKFESDGAGKVARDERLKMEQLLIKEQKKKEELDLEKERKKVEDAKMRQMLASAENQRLLERKQKEVEEIRRQDLLLKQKFLSDVEAFQRSEEEKKISLREKQANYRSELSRQLEVTKQKGISVDGITKVEKEINMPTLRSAMDPQVLSRVLHKARISKTSQG